MKKISSFQELETEFEGFLFDAYGVLVNDSGLLPGARETLNELNHSGKPYLMLSNGSSKTVAATAQRYRDLGLPFDDEQVITSGGVLADYLIQNGEPGEQIAVMGTPGSFEIVSSAGLKPVPILSAKGSFRFLVIANQTDYPLLDSIDEAITQVCHKIDRHDEIRIILSNPDLFYPKGGNGLGITAGSIANVMESVLMARYGTLPNQMVTKLGKPHAPMFKEAIKRLGGTKLLMVGDQILTDIKGANQMQIGSLLMGTGLSHISSLQHYPEEWHPDYYLEKW